MARKIIPYRDDIHPTWYMQENVPKIKERNAMLLELNEYKGAGTIQRQENDRQTPKTFLPDVRQLVAKDVPMGDPNTFWECDPFPPKLVSKVKMEDNFRSPFPQTPLSQKLVAPKPKEKPALKHVKKAEMQKQEITEILAAMGK